MPGLEVGEICIKTHGREAGKRVVLLGVDKKTGFVEIAGPGVKKRKCNVKHLLAIGKKVELPKNASEKQIAEIVGRVK